jgi:hypothetical protein
MAQQNLLSRPSLLNKFRLPEPNDRQRLFTRSDNLFVRSAAARFDHSGITSGLSLGNFAISALSMFRV